MFTGQLPDLLVGDQGIGGLDRRDRQVRLYHQRRDTPRRNQLDLKPSLLSYLKPIVRIICERSFFQVRTSWPGWRFECCGLWFRGGLSRRFAVESPMHQHAANDQEHPERHQQTARMQVSNYRPLEDRMHWNRYDGDYLLLRITRLRSR